MSSQFLSLLLRTPAQVQQRSDFHQRERMFPPEDQKKLLADRHLYGHVQRWARKENGEKVLSRSYADFQVVAARSNAHI